MTASAPSERGAVAMRASRPAIAPPRRWFPPIHRREFWAVQALVLAIAAGHSALEIAGRLVEPPALYLVPTSLFFVPVVYAALNFGVRGSLPTALWSAVLTLPNLILWHAGLSRIGVIWQEVIILSLAIFVGIRVDHERNARQEAEDREQARRSSEERYRALFDNAAEAVLVIDRDGLIEEANEAATRLLDRPVDLLRGAQLSSIVGDDLAGALLAERSSGTVLALPVAVGSRPVWVEPIASSPLAGPDGAIHFQAMLHDVTHQHERQQGLEVYARRTLAAREEEQRRIGRELHDGPLQSLVLLARKLDLLGEPVGSAEHAGTVAQAHALAEETAGELRRISRALRPSVLDDLGLTTALKSEASALARRSGITVRFTSSGQARSLEPDTELMLLRVTQEALHNVERHSSASKVVVRLAFQPEKVLLLVRDDGTGLGAVPSASELLAAGKLGLVGMQERARLVQADVVIRNHRRGGTSIEVTVPG
jgi:signal transduction histidine kinase